MDKLLLIKLKIKYILSIYSKLIVKIKDFNSLISKSYSEYVDTLTLSGLIWLGKLCIDAGFQPLLDLVSIKISSISSDFTPLKILEIFVENRRKNQCK